MFKFIIAILFLVVVSPCMGQDQPDKPATTDQVDSKTEVPAKFTPEQLEELFKNAEEINELISEAGMLFKKKGYTGSVKRIKKAKKLMSEIVASGNEDLLKKLKHDYGRLTTAQKLLTDKGKKLEALPPLKEMGSLTNSKSESSSANQVSFSNDVAPILIQRCGRCHVQGAKGGFSALSFAAIKKGSKRNNQVFVAGEPEKSSLYMLVEVGEMPPRSKGIPKKEMKVLKDWIAQGAKYDGHNETDALGTLSRGKNSNRSRGPGR